MLLRAALVIAVVLWPAPARAQQWHLDAQAGEIKSALDPSSEAARNAVIGVRFEKTTTMFRVSAGVPTSSAAALWGAVAAGQRFAARRAGFVSGLDVGANAFVLHDRVDRMREVKDVFGRTSVVPAPALSGYAAAGQLMPFVAFEASSVQAQIRAGLSHYTSDFGGAQRNRAVSIAEGTVTILPTASLAIQPVARFVHAQEADYRFAGVTAIVTNGPLSVWGSAGQWLRDSAQVGWSAGGTLRVHKKLALTAGARSDVIDPIYLNPAQTSWSVGISYLLAGRSLAAPVPAHYRNGRATIELASHASAKSVSIAGDFNAWKPAPMERSGKGWVYRGAIAPGVYNYAFVDDGGRWFVPEGHPGRKSDGMGGYVAVLVVK